MTEIEVKIRIGDAKVGAREKILALGAVVVRDRHLEKNILYDFASGSLGEGRRALRLRITGKRAALTFKGEPQKSRSFKVREEFETQVRDPRQPRRWSNNPASWFTSRISTITSRRDGWPRPWCA